MHRLSRIAHGRKGRPVLSFLCDLFGYSKQAYYKSLRSCFHELEEDQYILSVVLDIREEMPNLGSVKLCKMLKDNNLNIGRDKFLALLRANGLLLKKRVYKPRTTDSRSWLHQYDNLVKGLHVTHPDQVWVSDITYLSTLSGFVYLSLVTDAYSRRVMGWHVHETLDASGPLLALRMALASSDSSSFKGIIHHSDRGTQYCSLDYTDVLKEYKLFISTTQDGSPYDNAIAERVNGILKREWLNDMTLTGVVQAREAVGTIVKIYNTRRPHHSIGLQVPNQVYKSKDPRFAYVMF